VKKLTTLVVAFVLPLSLLGSFAAKADSIPGEQFVISNPPTNDRYTGINLADSKDAKETFSSLEAMTANGTSPESTILTRTPCKHVGDPGCEADKYFQYNAQLGMCDSSSITDCVTRVFATDENGNQYTGKFVENFPGDTSFTYPGDPKLDLPPGASTFIVDFPQLPHAGGTKYLVVVAMDGDRGFGESKFHMKNFVSGIFAVSKVNGQFSVTHPEPQLRPDITLNGRSASQGGFGRFDSNPTANWSLTPCVQTSPTQCLLPWTLPANVTFGVSIKMHEKIRGWLHGRLVDAQSTITKASDGDELITIQGKPTVVPGIYGWFKKSDYPEALKTYYASMGLTNVNATGLGWPANDGAPNGPDGLPYSIMKNGFGYNEGSFKEILAWISALGDKAAYAQSVWSFRAIEDGSFANCMKGSDSLSGIVATSSTMYVGNPPSFDRATQTLNYKVVSPHFLPDGSVFKGSYDLIIKSDVARCIYGFSTAPVSATISVISASGTEEVATTTFNEKGGWMYLAARNFTFSSPTVKVTLKQTGSKSGSATKAQGTLANNAKQMTITCVKGLISKKVSGVNPACPVGYKKR